MSTKSTKGAFLAHRDTDRVNSRFSFDLMPRYETEKTLKFQQQKYLTVGKSLLSTLPDFSGVFVRNLSKVLLLASVGTVLTALPGWSVGIKPSSVTVTNPVSQSCSSTVTTNCTNNGTRNGSSSQPYVDDILLNTITFGTRTFSTTNIREGQQAGVVTGRGFINAEFGDLDDNKDGNPNPFGVNPPVPLITQESTDPKTQDPAIKNAFNSLSLSQGLDGEEAAEFSYKLTFKEGIVDNNSGVDQIPELVFFERGINSNFTVRAITGGTFDNPTLSNPVSVTAPATELFATGIHIDTSEIDAGQQLGAIGFDLNEFGISAGQTVYGVQVTSPAGAGADIYGQFATTQNTANFRTVPPALVPEPLTILGSGIALGFGTLMKIQYSRKRKKAQQIV